MKIAALLFCACASFVQGAVTYTLVNRSGVSITETLSATTIAAGASAVITGQRSCLVDIQPALRPRTLTVGNLSIYPVVAVPWGVATWDHRGEFVIPAKDSMVFKVADDVTGVTVSCLDHAVPETHWGLGSSYTLNRDLWITVIRNATPGYAGLYGFGSYVSGGNFVSSRSVAFIPSGSVVICNGASQALEVSEPLDFWIKIFLMGFAMQTSFEMSGWLVRLIRTLKHPQTMSGV